MSLPVESKPLSAPSLDELASVLQKGLQVNFESVEVSVVECPDLTQTPYKLPAKGMSGSSRIAEVGGVPYLIPSPNKSKLYDLSKVSELAGLKDSFLFGAGAGPFDFVGTNSEMMPNLVTGNGAHNNSRACKMEGENYKLMELPENQCRCGLLGNFFLSEGLPGKVIKVRAKKRTGEENLISCMRKSLETNYPTSSIGMGGIFSLLSGQVKCHVMPDFSQTELRTEEDLNKWLRFFNFPAPMIFFSVFVSRDPGLDLRLEHSHGYGDTYGGHYHYDVTPDEVEYEGYFQVAESLYRIDRPVKTHNIGRD